MCNATSEQNGFSQACGISDLQGILIILYILFRFNAAQQYRGAVFLAAMWLLAERHFALSSSGAAMRRPRRSYCEPICVGGEPCSKKLVYESLRSVCRCKLSECVQLQCLAEPRRHFRSSAAAVSACSSCAGLRLFCNQSHFTSHNRSARAPATRPLARTVRRGLDVPRRPFLGWQQRQTACTPPTAPLIHALHII